MFFFFRWCYTTYSYCGIQSLTAPQLMLQTPSSDGRRIIIDFLRQQFLPSQSPSYVCPITISKILVVSKCAICVSSHLPLHPICGSTHFADLLEPTPIPSQPHNFSSQTTTSQHCMDTKEVLQTALRTPKYRRNLSLRSPHRQKAKQH